MSLETFYEILSGICFALTGLWWTVVAGRKDWLKNQEMRSLAGGVYASFLIPGVMSLGAQIGGDNKLVWRSVFVIAALLGMIFHDTPASSHPEIPKSRLFCTQPLAGGASLCCGSGVGVISYAGSLHRSDHHPGGGFPVVHHRPQRARTGLGDDDPCS